MRDIKINGEVRTVYTEVTNTFYVSGIYCNTITLLFDFGSLLIQQDGPVLHENDMQLHGPVLYENDIQEISGAPLKPGCGCEKLPGMVKLNCGPELPVTYCLNGLESCDITIMKECKLKSAKERDLREQKENTLEQKKAKKARLQAKAKEEEDRALALEREKAKTALIIARDQAIKQPAAESRQVIALKEKLARAQEAGASTLEEALKKWMRFDPPGMGASTKAHIEKAVHLYTTDPDKRSLSKIAAEFHVSRTTVSKWFKAFTKETGFPVVSHQQNESVRERTFVDAAGPTTKKKSHSGWYDPEGEAN